MNNSKLKDSVIHSFPGIGVFTTETIKAYHEAGWLAQMLTTIVVHKEKKWVKLLYALYPGLIQKFKSRNFSEIPIQKIRIYPYRELLRLLSVRYLSLITTDKIWEWAELSFDRWAAQQLNKNIKIVHAYEHAALATFEKATSLGMIKILEQTSQHYSFYEELANEQFQKYPELKSEYNQRISGELFIKRNERKKKEHDLADLIICNSSFTKRTLTKANVEDKKIIVIPLAFPTPIRKISKPKSSEIFTFLYTGSLSVRKGTHLLLEIWQKNFSNHDHLKLRLIGKNLLPNNITRNCPKNVEILDFVPQDRLDQFYDEADIFVFPTLADGFGMVITEAMARGLPVIASHNSAGPDLIIHKHNGLIVNSGDIDDLTEKMNWCLANKESLPKMANEALIKANSYQWADYRKELISKISAQLHA